MTLFFKHIRQQLLINKKFGKYFLYALGEILIVIIGILVAVKVNNSNETSKNKSIEISILKALKEELQADLATLQEEDLPLLKEVLVSSDIIMNHIEKDLPYNDSLAYHFLASIYTTHLIYNKGAITTLRSIGVNTITNEKLRNQIIRLYDEEFDFLDYQGVTQDNYHTHVRNFILYNRFDQLSFDDPMTAAEYDGKMVPLDFDGLKSDSAYLFHLQSYKNITSFYLDIFIKTESSISEVISDIEEELNELEK